MAGQVGKQHRRWRRLRRWGWIVLLPLAVFLLPPQVSRVTIGELPQAPAQPRVADEVNGWVALQPLLSRIEGDLPASDAERGEGLVPAARRAWLKQNAALLPELDRALAYEAWSWPRPAVASADLSALRQYRSMVRLVSTAAMAAEEDGQPQVAAKRLAHLLRANDELFGCEGALIQMLVAIAGDAITLRAIRDTAAAGPIDEDWAAWQPVLDRLDAEPDTGWALAGALHAEDLFFWTTLSERGPGSLMEPDKDLQLMLFPSWFFDPWRTRADYRGFLDVVAAQAARPRPERHWTRYNELIEQDGLPSYNRGGRALLETLLPVMQKCLDKTDRALTQRRLTATTIALRRGYDKLGKLPPSLEDLVRLGLLEAVPTDPCDGQPLRYSAAKGRVWSVDLDRIDHQGEARDYNAPTRDEVVELLFR